MIFLPFANVASRLKQTFTDFVYFVVLPMIYTANGEDAKSSILQNELYLRFSDFVFERWINKIIPADAENEDEENEKNICDSCGEEMKPAVHVHNLRLSKIFLSLMYFIEYLLYTLYLYL